MNEIDHRCPHTSTQSDHLDSHWMVTSTKNKFSLEAVSAVFGAESAEKLSEFPEES